MATKTLDIPIIGPTHEGCTECATRFQDSVGKLAGVQSASSSQGTVTLTFDPDRLSLSDIESKAREIGIELEKKYGHKLIPIAGMDCADCARKIENGVRRISGVLSASVNFATSTLSVEYEANCTDTDRITLVVQRLGYETLARPSAPEGRAPMPQAPLRNRRVLLTGGSGLLMMLGLGVEFAARLPTLATWFYILAGLLVARYVVKGAWGALLSRTIETDILMSLAAIGAACLGDFREMAAVLFLYTLGETLESFSVARARGAIRDLVQSFPSQVTVLQNGIPHLVTTINIQPGDKVLVRPGDKIVVDGIVRSGESEVDESLVTGESTPVIKRQEDHVFAGSLNGSGALEVECRRSTSDNTVNRIIHMVEEAQSRKAPIQRMSESFGAVYTPVVIGLAVTVAVAGPLVFNQGFSESFRKALILLTVSCPCALILAAPVSIVSALAAAAKNGVLIKGGSVLEALGRVRTISFDKTGTLTLGQLQVTDVISNSSSSESDLVRLVASLESRSEHIIGQAIVRHAKNLGIALGSVSDFQAKPGLGASAMVGDKWIGVGNTDYFRSFHIETDEYQQQAEALSAAGKIVLLVGIDKKAAGLIALQDEVRPEAQSVISQLRGLGVNSIALITGDRDESAQKIATVVGIKNVRSRMLPEDKLKYISEQCKSADGAAMVGDGINDAPALARATVGIAIGSATDASAETAEVLLMSNDLTRLPYSFDLAQSTVRVIRHNLFFSVGVVFCLIGLTVTGHLTLPLGVVGHEGSSLIVVANGIRLLRVKPKIQARTDMN